MPFIEDGIKRDKGDAILITKRDVQRIVIVHLQAEARKRQHFVFSVGNLVSLVWESQTEEYRKKHLAGLPHETRKFILEVIWDLVIERVVTPINQAIEIKNAQFFVSDDNRHKLSLEYWKNY